MTTLNTIEDLEAAEAAHDPATCGDPTCAAAPEGSTWSRMNMSIAPNGVVSFHHEAESRAALRIYHEHEWRELCESYLADPTDFVTAHHWLEQHPIFHSFMIRGDVPELPADPQERRHALAALEAEAYQVTDQGLAKVWLSVFTVTDTDDIGPAGPRVMLEHGPCLWASERDTDEHVPLDGCPTHDPDVDSYATSYEAAIVEMARNVHTKYGTDRSRI